MNKSKLSNIEWGLCSRCKHQNSDKCSNCTSIAGYQDITICNIPVGLSMQYYHKYFEEQAEPKSAISTRDDRLYSHLN